MSEYTKLLAQRGERIVKKLGTNSKVCLLSSDIIFKLSLIHI